MKYHIIAFVAGLILDLILGDPHFMPHPIRLIGGLITKLEKLLYCEEKNKKRGLILVILVTTITGAISFLIWFLAYYINPILGVIVEAIMTYYILAIKSLKVESMKVYKKIKLNDIKGARMAVSMIVGRDTDVLDREGIIKASVETVAENTSDGVIAPMLYTMILGPVAGYIYKSINTMDSMVGYKNEKYKDFGFFPAKLDDLVNFIPARISAYLMILATTLSKKFDTKNAYRIFKRDRFNHTSPNSAQTESVCAGALKIRLAGPAVYFGVVYKKKFIGDMLKKISDDDIKNANTLMYYTAFLSAVMGVGFLVLIDLIWKWI